MSKASAQSQLASIFSATRPTWQFEARSSAFAFDIIILAWLAGCQTPKKYVARIYKNSVGRCLFNDMKPIFKRFIQFPSLGRPAVISPDEPSSDVQSPESVAEATAHRR